MYYCVSLALGTQLGTVDVDQISIENRYFERDLYRTQPFWPISQNWYDIRMNQYHQNNRDFYDRISQVYDAIADSSEHAAREAGQKLLDVQLGQRVLEIGFGTGNSFVEIAKQVGAQGRVSGVDVSQGMLNVTAAKVQEAGLGDRAELKLGDGVELEWADQSFDSVFMSFTLELFSEDDLPRVLAEVKRVLVPGGRFANVSMATVKPDERESVLELTYQWMHRHFPHIVDCRPIDVRELLTEAGLTVETEDRIAIWSMPVSITLSRTCS